MLQDVVIRGVGQHRGAPRLFLDMPELARAKFSRGAAYRLDIDSERVKITVRLDDEGDRVVCGKERGGTVHPVIDLSSHRVMGLFSGHEKVRIVFMVGRIHILPMASVLAQEERLERLRRKFRTGEPLTVASIAHGGGVMTHAAHAGAMDAGVQVRSAVVNEIDEDLMGCSRANNDTWSTGTVGLTMPMQELVQDAWVFERLPRVELLEGGVPCSGHSRAGTSKRKLQVPEAHPLVGHLVAPTLMLVQKMQPAIVVLENVVGYSTAGSAWVLRSMLRDMGYSVFETVLNSTEFGCLEERKRWFLVAVTNGLSVSLDGIAPEQQEGECLSSILDPVDDDDPRWRSFDYLREKERRDLESGKNFRMQVVEETDKKIPLLRKGYHKGGSTDPLLKHPRREGLFRLLTGDEHARAAQVPTKLIAGRSDAEKHQMLGQGVAYPVVRALFARVLSCAREAAESLTQGQHRSGAYGLKGTG